MADLDELERLHAEAVTNKGGDFEVDCDEALRLAAMEHLPALIAELRALRELRDAVEESDGAYLHYPPCDLMHEMRGCRCGHEVLSAALAKAKKACDNE